MLSMLFSPKLGERNLCLLEMKLGMLHFPFGARITPHTLIYLSTCDVPAIFARWWQIFSAFFPKEVAFQKRPLRKLSVYTIRMWYVAKGFYH